jgi:hypothetical protein
MLKHNLLAALLLFGALLGFSGCRTPHPDGDGYQKDPVFDMPRKLRAADSHLQSAALSDRSQQIERDLGVISK